MPKVTWSSPIEHSSDATFRVWGSDLAARLAAAGLVQTADTGQINWVTVTRPISLAYGGYEIWRFADTLQGAAPVFLKIEYGTSNNVATPAIRVTMGTSTNGAGTLTGLVTSARACYAANTLVAGAGSSSFPSYVVHTAGFFGLAFKFGASTSANLTLFGLTVQRSVDNSGIPTAAAVMMITCGSSNQDTAASDVSQINYATSTVNNTLDGTDLGGLPARITSSLVGVDPQIFLTWMVLPKMTPNLGTAVYIRSEVPNFTEIDIALIGVTPRHFIAMGSNLRKCLFNGGSAPLGTLMLWET